MEEKHFVKVTEEDFALKIEQDWHVLLYAEYDYLCDRFGAENVFEPGIGKLGDEGYYVSITETTAAADVGIRAGDSRYRDKLMRPITTEEEKKMKKKPIHVDLERKGTKIILPEEMPFNDGINWLRRWRDEEDTLVAISEDVQAYPMDGAFAFARAISQLNGFSQQVPTPGFFGSRPPVMIGLSTGVDESVQVPWGRVEIPGIKGYLETSYSRAEGNMPIFVIKGEVRKGDKEKVIQLANLTRRLVKNESIYRGRAIRVRFPDEMTDFDPSISPKFLDTSKVKDKELIFSDETMQIIQTSIFTPIEHTAECRKNGIPLKRGILLEGPYGVGKTLTADVMSKLSEDNGWTFIYLQTVEDLAQAILFAKQYQPAVIFAEDVDSVVSGERRGSLNEILNTIDGIESKGTDIMVCLTTNHVERINKAMLRPGRLDAVISIRPPDAKAVEKLIRLYGRNRIGEGEPLNKVATELEGQIPALIREVVERSKLAAIHRNPSGDLHLTEADLLIAASAMKRHLELLAAPPADDRSDMEKSMDRLGGHIAKAVQVGQPAKEQSLPQPVKNGSSLHDRVS